MVGTITPLVKTATTRRAKSSLAALLLGYVLATAASGLLLAAGLFLIAAAVRTASTPTVAVAVLGVCSIAILLNSFVTRRRLPMFDRQVPASWRNRYGPRRALLVYGLVLGNGFLTRINSPGLYILPVVALVAPTWLIALLPATIYAAARASVEVAAAITLRRLYMSDLESAFQRIRDVRVAALAGQALLLAALAGASFAVSST
jgi:hypothetical protein